MYVIPQDKANHFVAGAVVCSIVSRATGNRFYGFAAGVIAAIGREVYNKVKGGEFSLPDIGWTIAGVLTSFVVGGDDPLLIMGT